jgi:hypothetical protein
MKRDSAIRDIDRIYPVREDSESAHEDATRERVKRDLVRFTEKLDKGYSQARIRIFRRRIWAEYSAEFDAHGNAYVTDKYFNPDLSADEFLFYRFYMTNYKLPIPYSAHSTAATLRDALTSSHSWWNFHNEYADALLAGERATQADMRRQVLDRPGVARGNTFSRTMRT